MNITNLQLKHYNCSIGDKKMLTLRDLRLLPRQEYVLERLHISPGNLTLLCATGCSGKTMLVQYLATCVSSGKDLFDQFPVKKGAVLHFDQEQSAIQTERRYIRIANGLELNELNIMRYTLRKRFDDHSLDFENVELELEQECKDKVLCIIDSLKASSSTDENSAEIEILLKMFKRVAEKTRCAMLVVHHKGKGKDAKQSGRGHSSIYDSCDVQIDLSCDDDIYEISCAKTRESKYFKGIQYNLLDTGDFVKEQNCSEKLEFILTNEIASKKQTQKDKIINALLNNKELKQNDLFKLIGGDRNKFKKTLEQMITNNEVKETPGERRALIYSLRDKEGLK